MLIWETCYVVILGFLLKIDFYKTYYNEKATTCSTYMDTRLIPSIVNMKIDALLRCFILTGEID